MTKIKAVSLAILLLLGTTTAVIGPLYTAEATAYDYTQSDVIGTPVTMDNPTAFDIDGSGNYYVADGESYLIRKYNSAGQELLSFGPGDYSTMPEEFGWVEGIAVKSNGDIYVTDGDNLRVQVYSATGQYLRTVGDTVFDNWPYKLTFDSTGKLYVSDGDAVRVFDSNDNLLMTIGSSGTGDGEFSTAGDIDVDTNGDIYVLDNGNSRVEVFDAAGTFLRKFGSYTSASNGDTSPELFQYPYSIKIHSDGNLRILDRDRVKTFTKAGVYISKFGANGYEPGQFTGSGYLGISGDGKIHTLESGIDRIQTFTASGTYLSQFGNEGSDTSQFFGPLGVATDSSDNIYVVDSVNNRVQKFAPDGTFLLQWGGIGTGNGQFNRPRAIAINNTTGRVYVSEWRGSSYPKRIQIFDLDGNYISQFGSSGTGDGQFNSIMRIAISSTGTVYVSDQGANRVQAFDANGVFLRKWTTSNFPSAIAVDAAENVYVVTDPTSYIYKYSSTGTLLATYGSATAGTADGKFTSPGGIIVDADGIIYIADSGNHRIQIFDTDGTFLHKFGTLGDGTNQFVYPQALALDSNMRLIVADDDNNRIPIYSIGSSASAPTEPQNVTTDTTTPNQAIINWAAPSSDGGSAITNYTLEYKLTADSSWTSVNIVAPTTSRTLSSLTAGQYDARVSATNSAGTSASTTPIILTVTDPTPPATAPSTPQNLTATSPAANTIATTWQAPASDGGDGLTHYTLEYKLTSDSTWTQVTVGAPATGHTLTNIPAGSYNIHITATNSIGTSGFSNAVTATIADSVVISPSPDNPPANTTTTPSPATTSTNTSAATSQETDITSQQAGPATQGTIEARTDEQSGNVTVSWQPPTGSTPTGYVIEYRNATIPENDTTTPWKHISEVSSEHTSATITLPEGSYIVRVAAVLPGDKTPRIILGVAHITIPHHTATAALSPSSDTSTKTWPLWAIVCATAFVIVLFALVPFLIWRHKRKKQQQDQLPPRWQNPTY